MDNYLLGLTFMLFFQHAARMILLDAHAHVYDCYDLNTALQSALNHFRAVRTQNPVWGCALAERSECHFFQRLENGSQFLPDGWRIERPASPYSIRLTAPTGESLWFIAGRQIKTAENLEISALFFRDLIPDGTPIREALKQIMATGGVPSLNWALGKWLFRRGFIVRELITEFAEHLILCDSSLRPRGFPAPSIFYQAKMLGIPMLSGTDPLPSAYDQTLMGSCGTAIRMDFDPAHPDESFRTAVRAPDSQKASFGRHSTLMGVLIRQLHFRRAKRQSR